MGKSYLAVDIGGTKTLLGIFDREGELKYRVKFSTSKNSFAENVAKIKKEIDGYFESSSPKETISGIGLGLPAVYDKKNDTIQKAANLKSWENSKVIGVLQDEFNCEVCVHSDVYAALLGEKMYGEAKNSENFINISVGTGVGMGIFIDNSIYIGANGFAGGIGHTIFKENGYPCRCGKRGCVENYVNGRAMERLLREKIKKEDYRTSSLFRDYQADENVTSFEIIDAAQAGDDLGVEIINDIGYNLGIVVSNIVMLFDPEVVILNGGVIINSPDFLLDRVRRIVEENLFKNVYVKTRIEKSGLENDANLYGNFWLIKNAVNV